MTQKRRVLVVDDEVELRQMVAEKLERENYHVIQASGGLEALEYIKKNQFDVVISDIRMPEGDGIELMKGIRKIDPYHPPIIFVTGFLDNKYEFELHQGACLILDKPFNSKTILSALEKALVPKENRWKEDLDINQSSIELNRTYQSLEAASQALDFSLGYGGMFLAVDNEYPALNLPVKFCINIESDKITKIEGKGIVRWIRVNGRENLKDGCGIEFIFLTEESRIQLIEWINTARPTSFIPAF